jgi:hypothetical protein
MTDNNRLIPTWVPPMIVAMFAIIVALPLAALCIVAITLIIEHFAGPL